MPSLTDPWRLGGHELPNRLVLAPLAGIGNWFVRLQAKRYGAGLAVSEMVSSFGLKYGDERTHREFLRIHPDEHPVSIQLFGHDPDVMRLGAIVLIFCAIYQLFDAMYIVYNGALRGAGDTFVPAVTLFVLCWGIMVGGGYAVARLRPEWGIVGPWTMSAVYGAILGVFILARFCRGRWRAIRLETQDASDTVRGFVPAAGTEPA